MTVSSGASPATEHSPCIGRAEEAASERDNQAGWLKCGAIGDDYSTRSQTGPLRTSSPGLAVASLFQMAAPNGASIQQHVGRTDARDCSADWDTLQ